MDEYLIRRSPAEARRQVWDRDHGVCRACGLDCEHLRAALARLARSPRTRRLASRLRVLLAADPGRSSFWDADHVVPVAAGGGGCGLGNYQTLCVWCHKGRTAAQAAARHRREVPLTFETGKTVAAAAWAALGPVPG